MKYIKKVKFNIYYIYKLMSKFTCDKCNKNFTQNINLMYHIDHNSCKIRYHRCIYCNKNFATKNSMYRHMKHSCRVKKQDEDAKKAIYEQLLELHKQVDELKNKSNKLEAYNKKLANVNKKLRCNKIVNNHSINNGTINNNIVLIGYGKEDLSKIDKNHILKSFKKGYYSTIYLTEAVHFNPMYPEYHNVYISNIKDKYAMMYDGHEWTLTRKTELIDRLYENKKNYIEDNMEEFIDTLTRSQARALERWLNTEDEHDKIKEVKDKIKLLLYNKRGIPLAKG